MITPPASINSFYIGINIENILYGIELVLYFKTIYGLQRNTRMHKKSKLSYALFSTTMVFLVTVWVANQAVFGREMWLLNPNYPGGADAYWSDNVGVWYMHLATIMVIVLQLMTDGLMIYRCRIIWNSHRAVVVPVILWLATLILGVLVAWVTGLPRSSYHTGFAVRLYLAYWSISVFLNTTLTCMICYRVVRHGRKVQELLGREYASLYFTFATTVVESVLPYTLSGIAFLVSLGVRSPTSMAFVFVYFLMMCISPQMLILRVATGKAWDNETFSQADSTVKFSPLDTLGSEPQWSGMSEVRVQVQTLSNVYLPGGCDEVMVSQA